MSPGIPTRLLATQSDERLLALVREGHERAFEALVHRYRKPLLYYARRLPLPDARAEDIVQLALLKTWIAVREGAEVRDLKAWLYRVVHNTAVNAIRDAAHDGDPVADPPLRLGAGESDVDRGLALRETLAEVAALPALQREVIVRTAVAGHSHEQVASDLGITDGAVRGLLYRARLTLRATVTALTPPPLIGWFAGRAEESGPAPERLTELATGGGTAGLGGLLLKGGVLAVTAGTVITGAAVVHFRAPIHRHRHQHKLTATAAPTAGAIAARPSSADSHLGGPPRGAPSLSTRSRRGAHTGYRAGRGRQGAEPHAPGTRRLSTGSSGRTPRALHMPRSPSPARGNVHAGAPAVGQTVSTTPSGGSAPGGPVQSGAPGQGGSSGGGGEPVGSAAGNGSGAGASQAPSPGEGGGSSGAGQPGGGSGSGSPEGSSGSSGSEPTGSGTESSGSGKEQSGSLVGTVVHEVGNILEHLLP
ncbi:MAG TPA: sigma-70 family RNA polymerase sigma factor [Solirubrobacteraceae bacterium]|jgi:RNA polymerase sigma factor (sigma-70 family)|nr:sigma-70 family RNA polymerase sigma factor [Solirubrobacteraceae bacterium]